MILVTDTDVAAIKIFLGGLRHEDVGEHVKQEAETLLHMLDRAERGYPDKTGAPHGAR